MKKFLVIDDDKDILDAVQMILQMEGYDSLAIAKGEEVYKSVNNYKPDVIILDVLLSGNDGRNICKKIKADKKTKKIPIIMISAHPTARDSVVQCGADGFLPKPFSVAALLDEVQKFL